MDLTDTIAPKSDQLNSDDLLTGPRTFTIDHVSAGSAEQPVDIHLVEFPGRPYRPSKSMRRVLVAAWGPDAANYVGRRVTLFRDPSVQFGGSVVGGIKISHLSGIDKRLTMALTATRGKKAMHVVEPLPDVVPAPQTATVDQLEVIKSNMDRLGMSPARLLEIASEGVRRTIAHPRELTPTEADDLVRYLVTGKPQPADEPQAERPPLGEPEGGEA